MVQQLRRQASIAGGVGSISGWGTGIPRASWQGQKKELLQNKTAASSFPKKVANLCSEVHPAVPQARGASWQQVAHKYVRGDL